MRSWEWSALVIFSILMMSFFIFEDNSYRIMCVGLGPQHFESTDEYTEYIKNTPEQPLTKADIWSCLNSEIYDPFIWLLGWFGIFCFIMAGISSHYEKKRK